MLYSKNQSEKLDPALFQNPTAEYRITPTGLLTAPRLYRNP